MKDNAPKRDETLDQFVWNVKSAHASHVFLFVECPYFSLLQSAGMSKMAHHLIDIAVNEARHTSELDLSRSYNRKAQGVFILRVNRD